MWQGMDGLRGPGLSGSGNYLSRSALLFGSPNQKGKLTKYKYPRINFNWSLSILIYNILLYNLTIDMGCTI